MFTSSKQTQGEPSLSGTDGTGGGGTLDSVLGFFGKAADIYSTVKGAGKTSLAPSGQVTGNAQAQPPSNVKKYLLWGGGGLVALLVLYLVFRKRG